MSFLAEIQTYVARYRSDLSRMGYSEIRSSDGPGMGAVIGFTKARVEFDLTNDRGQFFVYLRRSGDTKNYFDLSVFLAMKAVTDEKKDISKMSFEEKTNYWKKSYSYSDPMVELLGHLEFAEHALSDGEIEKTKTWTKEYYRKRGDWLFPKKDRGTK